MGVEFVIDAKFIIDSFVQAFFLPLVVGILLLWLERRASVFAASLAKETAAPPPPVVNDPILITTLRESLPSHLPNKQDEVDDEYSPYKPAIKYDPSEIVISSIEPHGKSHIYVIVETPTREPSWKKDAPLVDRYGVLATSDGAISSVHKLVRVSPRRVKPKYLDDLFNPTPLAILLFTWLLGLLVAQLAHHFLSTMTTEYLAAGLDLVRHSPFLALILLAQLIFLPPFVFAGAVRLLHNIDFIFDPIFAFWLALSLWVPWTIVMNMWPQYLQWQLDLHLEWPRLVRAVIFPYKLLPSTDLSRQTDFILLAVACAIILIISVLFSLPTLGRDVFWLLARLAFLGPLLYVNLVVYRIIPIEIFADHLARLIIGVGIISLLIIFILIISLVGFILWLSFNWLREAWEGYRERANKGKRNKYDL